MRALYLAGLPLPLLAGCDFQETRLGDEYALCAVDTDAQTTLCRDLTDGNRLGLLDPVVVAAGDNAAYVTAEVCSPDDGRREYWSVHKNPDPFADPERTGPLSREEFEAARAAEPVRWPQISLRLERLDNRFCARAEG